MPRIVLKPKSPEFMDDHAPGPASRGCDMPGCAAHGSHKAPKNRGLNDYYWFCLEHVTDYNKAWDFFSGMSETDIEDHIRRSFLWDRPTRRFDSGDAEGMLRRKASQTRFFSEEGERAHDHEPEYGAGFRFSSDPAMRATPEMQAMALMGLEPPLDLEKIKARYKTLVKQYHPDLNPNNPKAEDMIKTVNMSYTILKLAYEKYETLHT